MNLFDERKWQNYLAIPLEALGGRDVNEIQRDDLAAESLRRKTLHAKFTNTLDLIVDSAPDVQSELATTPENDKGEPTEFISVTAAMATLDIDTSSNEAPLIAESSKGEVNRPVTTVVIETKANGVHDERDSTPEKTVNELVSNGFETAPQTPVMHDSPQVAPQETFLTKSGLTDPVGPVHMAWCRGCEVWQIGLCLRLILLTKIFVFILRMNKTSWAYGGSASLVPTMIYATSAIVQERMNMQCSKLSIRKIGKQCRRLYVRSLSCNMQNSLIAIISV